MEDATIVALLNEFGKGGIKQLADDIRGFPEGKAVSLLLLVLGQAYLAGHQAGTLAAADMLANRLEQDLLSTSSPAGQA